MNAKIFVRFVLQLVVWIILLHFVGVVGGWSEEFCGVRNAMKSFAVSVHLYVARGFLIEVERAKNNEYSKSNESKFLR